MDQERCREDEDWRTRLDEVEAITRRLWVLSTVEQEYAALYVRLKAVRADLVDQIPPPSWPRAPGPIFNPQISSNSADSYAANASPSTKQPFLSTLPFRRCHFCGHQSHMIRNCRVAARYVKQGRCTRAASTGHFIQINGTPIYVSRKRTLKEHIDSHLHSRSYPRSQAHPCLRASQQSSNTRIVATTRLSAVSTISVKALSTLSMFSTDASSKTTSRKTLLTAPKARDASEGDASRRMSSGEG